MAGSVGSQLASVSAAVGAMTPHALSPERLRLLALAQGAAGGGMFTPSAAVPLSKQQPRQLQSAYLLR